MHRRLSITNPYFMDSRGKNRRERPPDDVRSLSAAPHKINVGGQESLDFGESVRRRQTSKWGGAAGVGRGLADDAARGHDDVDLRSRRVHDAHAPSGAVA